MPHTGVIAESRMRRMNTPPTDLEPIETFKVGGETLATLYGPRLETSSDPKVLVLATGEIYFNREIAPEDYEGFPGLSEVLSGGE